VPLNYDLYDVLETSSPGERSDGKE
jgi:hypothetical protein